MWDGVDRLLIPATENSVSMSLMTIGRVPEIAIFAGSKDEIDQPWPSTVKKRLSA